MLIGHLKWLSCGLVIIIQLSLIVRCEKCDFCFGPCDHVKIPPIPLLVTDNSYDIPFQFNCSGDCAGEQRCLHLEYDGSPQSCENIYFDNSTNVWWHNAADLKPNTQYSFIAKAYMPSSRCFVNLSEICLKENWVVDELICNEKCQNYTEITEGMNVCSSQCGYTCETKCQEITCESKCGDARCGNVTLSIKTKPKRFIGCYGYDSPNKPMFPGGIVVSPREVHLSTKGGVLCDGDSTSKIEILLTSYASRTDGCEEKVNILPTDSCKYVVDNLCPNTQYTARYSSDEELIAKFCTLPSEPSAPDNFKIERIFEKNYSYSYELTWSKPEKFIPEIEPSYILKWYESEDKKSTLDSASNLTEEKYVIGRHNFKSSKKYKFEVKVVYQEPHHNDKVIGNDSTLEATFDMDSTSILLQRLNFDSNIGLKWPPAKDHLTFVQYTLQLHLLEQRACKSLYFEGYIRRIQDPLVVTDKKYLEANWIVDKDQCYVATVDTIYKEGPSYALSNFFYTGAAPANKNGGNDLGIILGAVFGSLVLLALVGAIFFSWKKQIWMFDPKRRPRHITPEAPVAPTAAMNSERGQEIELENPYAIRMKTFVEEIKPRLSDDHQNSLKKEFEKLKKKCKTTEKSSSDANMTEIYHIRGSNLEKEYLISQRPATPYKEAVSPKDAAARFWAMIMNANIGFVVMLTTEEKQGMTLCTKYWPELGKTDETNKLKVRTETEKPENGFVRRKITLQTGNETRTVKHYQYKDWPIKACPDDPTPLLRFIHCIRAEKENTPNSGSLFIHCSQNFGRTSTFIVLDKILQDIGKHQSILDIFNYTLEVRKGFKKLGLDQDERQYIFIHQCIIHHLENPGESFYTELIPKMNYGQPSYFSKPLPTLPGDTDKERIYAEASSQPPNSNGQPSPPSRPPHPLPRPGDHTDSDNQYVDLVNSTGHEKGFPYPATTQNSDEYAYIADLH